MSNASSVLEHPLCEVLGHPIPPSLLGSIRSLRNRLGASFGAVLLLACFEESLGASRLRTLPKGRGKAVQRQAYHE